MTTLLTRRNTITDKSILTFPVHKERLQFMSEAARERFEGDCGLAIVRGDTREIVKAGLSSNYNLIPHADVINMVEAVFQANSLDFQVHDIYTGGTRGNKMFLHYTLPDYKIEIAEEEYIPFVQVQNSYDKSSLFKAITGLYRVVCSNGLIRYHSKTTLISAKHFGETVDLSKIAFNLDGWLEDLNVTKFKLEELLARPNHYMPGNNTLREDFVEKIFSRKKDIDGFLESGLVEKYSEELGQNQYALINAFTEYITHNLSSRMSNFDHVAKSYLELEKIFLN